MHYIDTNGCPSRGATEIIEDVSVQANFSAPNFNSDGFDTEFQFINQSSPNTDEVHWSLNNGFGEWVYENVFAPYSYTFTTKGETEYYELTLIAHNSEHGCYDTITKTIKVPAVFVFYAPNTFSPNGDEFNNTFYGHASDVKSVQLSIYNRWGEVIFRQSGTKTDELVWDGTYKGKVVQSGAYVYEFIIDPINQDLNAEEPGKFIYSGTVSVIK